MINKILVGATLKAFEDILTAANVPYKVRDDEETRLFKKVYNESDKKDLAYRQVRPAAERIASKEMFLFETGGEPMEIRLNYVTRELARDSFGEILFDRPDIGWCFSISIKDDANVLSTMPMADRDIETFNGKETAVINEIDDFGDRIFGVPCSNEYFDDVNEILMQIQPFDRATWSDRLSDEDFAYDKVITPMLKAIAAEMPRIFRFHPEAPRKLIEYFYGKIDYYFINPIEQLSVTRIGCVNAHGGLGRMPDNDNLQVPQVRFPTELLDTRFSTGKYGEISRDTIQFIFDRGWMICFKICIEETPENGKDFALQVYMPITPFGSYRDQVKWDPEA